MAMAILPRAVRYTDGACSGNPGRGGYGAVLRKGGKILKLSGGEASTTNNRMELTAAIKALQVLKKPATVRIFTDSKYLLDGAEKWMAGWKSKNWRKADHKPVLNQDLWHELDLAMAPHRISWTWVRGHSGDKYNEMADALARAGMGGA